MSTFESIFNNVLVRTTVVQRSLNMYIGKVSTLTGASRKAIRHYEEIGLLQGIARSGSYRIYNQHHVTIVSMIKRAQSVGIKLADMVPLVSAKQTAQRFPINLTQQLIESKRAQIKVEIQQAQENDAGLVALKNELEALFPDAYTSDIS